MTQKEPEHYYPVAGSDDGEEEEAGPSTGERKGSPSSSDVERAAGTTAAAASDMQTIAEREHSIASRERRISRLIQINIIILVISICFFSSRLIIPPPKLSMHKCAKLMSPASPMLDSLEFWEGDFTNYFNHTSKYRGPPTKELQEAWLGLWDYPPIGVDDEIVKDLNKTEAKHVEIIGSDPNKPTYAAMVEVFHQLHCLNLVRQATWPLDRFDKSWGDKLYPSDLEEALPARMHVDHCIETLRLSLMCYGDVTPVLLDHRTGHKLMRQLDFNVHHKCRNFDQLVDWTLENMVEVVDEGDGI